MKLPPPKLFTSLFQRRATLCSFLLLSLLPNNVLAQESAIEDYPINAEWQLVNTNSGIKRYADEYKSDVPHHPRIIGNKAYWLAGNGYSGGSNATNEVLVMDLTTGELTVDTTLIQNFLRGNATVEHNGRILSVGGSGNFFNHKLNNVFDYDPVTQAYRQQNAAPLAREDAMAEYYNGNVYVFGGWGFDTFNKLIVKINPEALAKLGESQAFYSEAEEQASWRKEVQVYNIENQEWTVVNDAPTDKPFRASTIIGEQVFLSAEQDWVTPSDILDIYTISENSWSTLTLPEALVNKKITAVGPLLVVYGQTDWAISPNSFWKTYIYDTQEQQWYHGVPLPNPSDMQEIFDLAVEGNSLYYFEYSKDAWDENEKRVYRIEFDVSTSSPSDYQPFTEQSITEFQNENGDRILVNETGNVLNLVLEDHQDYDLIWKGDGSDAQKAALKKVTQSIYQQVQDSFDFVFLVFNEENKAPHPAPYGYHTPVQNSITGLGMGEFDFSDDYGSNGSLESVVVLSSSKDIIHGPSLHELGHRWGNYLEGSMDAENQIGWVSCMHPDSIPYHWGLRDVGGQLGGWYEQDEAFGDNITTTYLINDAREGLVGFNGIGPGNNFIGYSDLELYLMGLVESSEVADIREPSVPPVELEVNPLFEIDSFNHISMDTIVRENGIRQPDVNSSRKVHNTLFVVVSKTPLTQDEWHNYEHQVHNFTKQGEDDYQRLNNFWEATDGKAALLVPNIHENLVSNKSRPASAAFDYDGDGLADLAVRRPSAGMQFIKWTSDNSIQRTFFGSLSTDVPISGDFDGDGKADIAVYRPESGHWLIKNSEDDSIFRITFGTQSGDMPVPADYDGDGIADIAIRRPSSGTWIIRPSSSPKDFTSTFFGSSATDIPVIGDYDGDGIDDIAIRRPETGQWFVKQSSDNKIVRIFFGSQPDDIPVQADYDGDGITDFAVRRPSIGMWFIRYSSTDQIVRAYFGGNIDDIPVPADYDGDGLADLAIRRPNYGQFIVAESGNGNRIMRVGFGGQASDIALAAPLSYRVNLTSNTTTVENTVKSTVEEAFTIENEGLLIFDILGQDEADEVFTSEEVEEVNE
ncbi:MAG: hypothetical protein AXW14_02905 [Alteromonas sp. Nap_26]|nr:MAG: hypothetical protein AXW14_02905 [Alteromonas sp. Nap_26]